MGDQNNKYFHKGVEKRKAQNMIKEVQCRDGHIVTSGDDIKQEAEGFFRDFLQFTPADYEGISVDRLMEIVPRCRDEDHDMLIREVSEEEIKGVLWAMPTDKSPGPDGFTAEFFKKAWSIVGTEFTTAIKSFFLLKVFFRKGLILQFWLSYQRLLRLGR